MSSLNSHEIVNHFGDMDLYLMDAILKGYIPKNGKVLDLGCGEGRNGIYFMKNEYEYHGIDQDASKIRLADYLSKSISRTKASFTVGSIHDIDLGVDFDVIIASRILHFVDNTSQFQSIWNRLVSSLGTKGIVYFSMDSAIVADLVTKHSNDKFEFSDGRISFALTEKLYIKMLNNLEEVEQLKTIIYRNQRVQSFGLMRKRFP